jgi:hypothetical protein
LAEGVYERGYGQSGPDVDWECGEADEDLDTSDLLRARHERQIISLGDRLWIVTDRVRADGSHRYTQHWHLDPSYSPEQVQVEERAGMIRTADPEGTNLIVQAVTNTPLSCALRHGETDPPGGWFAVDYREVVPAVQVDVSWEGVGEQLMVNLLYPFAENETGILSLQHLPSPVGPDDPGHSEGFRLICDDGLRVSYRAARTLGELQLEELTAQGGALLLVEPPRAPSYGLALGCMGLELGGERQPLGGENDFIYEIEGGEFRVVAPITEPGPERAT